MKHPRHYQIASVIQAALAPMLSEHTAAGGGLITVRHISLNGDFSVATITYAIIGGNAANAQKRLDEAAPLYRARLARNLNMRKTPKLVFRHDDEGLAADKMREFLEKVDADADN